MSNQTRMALAGSRMALMAAKNGSDLDYEMQSGRLPPEDYIAATQSCMGCACGEDCDQFLRESDGSAGFPGYCRNVDLLRRLGGL